MGTSSPDLSLDLKQTQTPKSINAFMREISTIGNVDQRKSKVEEYVQGMEEEMKKIEVFKRELPLCMILLNDAIVALKDEAKQCLISSKAKLITEEFLPLKRVFDEGGGEKVDKDYRDKKSWMSSAQLWSSNGYSSDSTFINGGGDKKQIETRVEEDRVSVTKNQNTPCKYWSGEGAFVPFKGYTPASIVNNKKKESKEEKSSVSGLSLLLPGLKTPTPLTDSSCLIPKSKSSFFMTKGQGDRVIPPAQQPQPQSQSQQQSQRKQRRCWSPELHRRFIGALQELGGSLAATPKQIRELMKVDGLTNDEVKSHLQKYRLHTRRAPNGSGATGNQPMVVMGGLWFQDNQYETSKSQSESPQGPLQLARATQAVSSMGGNSMEDEEDEKSEAYSWKGHSHKSDEVEA